MKIYTGCLGGELVPEKRRKELTEHMLTFLHQGGMMWLEQLQLFGCRILLLWPSELNSDGELSLFYNCFEGAIWGNVSYDAKIGLLEEGKMGDGQFSKVVRAARVLRRFYTGNSDPATRNAQPFDAQESSGWLNNLFGDRFSNVPVKPVTTSTFLGCSDDDRAAFWRPDGDVTFSPEMETCLQAVRAALDAIIAAKSRCWKIRHFCRRWFAPCGKQPVAMAL